MIEYTRQIIGPAVSADYSDDDIAVELDRLRIDYANRLAYMTPTTGAAGQTEYTLFEGPTFCEAVSLRDQQYAQLTIASEDNYRGAYTLAEPVSAPGVLYSGIEHDPYGAAAVLVQRHLTANAGQYINIRTGRHSISGGETREALKMQIDDLMAQSKQPQAMNLIRMDYAPGRSDDSFRWGSGY
jgi:hypothetical protein